MIDFDTLTDIGLKLLGNPKDPTVTRIRSSFYGTSIRVQSCASEVDAHVKANPANFANEALVLSHFIDAGLAARFPELLASSAEGQIIATRTCGEPMREAFKGSHVHHDGPILGYLADALGALVEVQATADKGKLLSAGSALFATDKLCDQIELMAKEGLEDSEMSQNDRLALRAAADRWLPLADELVLLGLGDFWDHGDFGSGNVLLSSESPKRAVLIDLSESTIVGLCFPASQFIHRLHGHLGIDPRSADGLWLLDFWAQKAAEFFGFPKSSLERGFAICASLYEPYGLLMTQRLAKAHREHSGSKFANPILKKISKSHLTS